MSKTPTATASNSSRKARVAAKPWRLLRWLDYLPLTPLVVATVLLALSPPFAEPHLWQKLKMLAAGRLSEPLDVFDVALHAILPAILLLKWLRLHALGRVPIR